MRYFRCPLHLDDQILAVLRDNPGETTRFVVVVLYHLPRHFLYATTYNRGYSGILSDIEARITSLRRRRFVEVAGKSRRDRRQNTYQLTAQAVRYSIELADLPPVEVRR